MGWTKVRAPFYESKQVALVRRYRFILNKF